MDAADEHYTLVRDACTTKKFLQQGKRMLGYVQEHCSPSPPVVDAFEAALAVKRDMDGLGTTAENIKLYRAAVFNVLAVALPPLVHSYLGEWVLDRMDDAKTAAGGTAKSLAMHSDILKFINNALPKKRLAPALSRRGHGR